MTATPSLPEPSVASPGGSGFRDPMTRALLAHSGFTTPALEAIVGATLAVRVLHQYDTYACRLPRPVVGALRVSGHDRVLVRHSELVDGEQTVSTNLVFTVGARAADYGVDDAATPIGRSLILRGIRQQRHILWVGLASWSDGRLCAARTYVMLLDRQPLCYIKEVFSPQFVMSEHCDPRPQKGDESRPAAAPPRGH